MTALHPIHHDQMMNLITGGFASQIVRTFAEFSIADMLAERSATAAEISSIAGTHSVAMARLLRAGEALGLVTMDQHERFAPTELLGTLQRGSSGSLHGLAIAVASAGQWLPWANLSTAIRTGKGQAVATLGSEYFDYLERTPTEAQAFIGGMTGVSNLVGDQVAKNLDTRSIATAIDVGGGSGSLLHALLAANPSLHGIVYDRPEVVPAATSAAKQQGLEDRLSVVGGDFLESVPEADLYLLKWILHDWDNESCIKLLTNCRRAMRSGGRVVIVEMELDEKINALSPLVDLSMLVLLDGRERTTTEYVHLLVASGLRLRRVTPLMAPLGPWSLIEAEAP
jgi:precorrin-6B methylase 2